MRRVGVDGFAAWRRVARSFLAAGVEPRGVDWAEDEGQGSLLGEAPLAPSPERAAHVPRRFLELAEAVACHADAERWALLYAVLWRLTHGEPKLMQVATDPAVYRLLRMEKAVRRETHKMKAFVRFRAVTAANETHYLAWYEPEHDVLERTAPFFAERFASMRWSILTPWRCAHFDGGELCFGPGATRAEAATGDPLETLWRTYYASTFNPARIRTRAMRGEMPLRYWKNLPEAVEIAPLVQAGPARVRRMLEGTADEHDLPRRRSRSAPQGNREGECGAPHSREK